ncbi:hypothetical protein PVAND_005483 [Polypedilum vanderplanki]|uniref:ZP domain-containing protein n=1 Tax=Polypedilum vanderplanki TaxID=319348 RepID=A0A9J6C279_POLVA|nr:hypothetical protein PVAND_005483 [Polypedilum vanderplanki]
MATKYSFNVRTKRTGDEEKSARKIIKEDDKTNESTSQTIIIPTKGFSAEATKCLPNESEIEIQTGPNFSGKIVSENSKCEIQGNPNDDSETYVMRIDHEKCGSRVSNDDLTVETYITVQENTGILTHSTRKFLVVCTFQPDTLTVRAKLALPSKNGEVIPDDEEQQMWSPDRERSSRNRQFKMVDKSALILKESNEHSIENAIGDIENLTEKILAKEKISQVHIANELNEKKNSESFKNPRFSRYATEHEKNNNSLTGITLGIGSVLIIIFIAFVALFYASKKRTGMEKLQTAATYN